MTNYNYMFTDSFNRINKDLQVKQLKSNGFIIKDVFLNRAIKIFNQKFSKSIFQVLEYDGKYIFEYGNKTSSYFGIHIKKFKFKDGYLYIYKKKMNMRKSNGSQEFNIYAFCDKNRKVIKEVWI